MIYVIAADPEQAARMMAEARANGRPELHASNRSEVRVATPSRCDWMRGRQWDPDRDEVYFGAPILANTHLMQTIQLVGIPVPH